MRLVLISRLLKVVLTIVAILCCACVRSPAPRFYALSSMQEGQDLSSRRSPAKDAVIGIGPVIARTLNQAGIFTFAELAALTADDLRGIVGNQIQRLADEDKILSQARQLAEKQSRGG